MNDIFDFFELAPNHQILAGCGLIIMVGYWLPQFFPNKKPAVSIFLILGGLLAFGFTPYFAKVLSPINFPERWETPAEIAVIIALFGTGIRIDKLADLKRWRPTIGLLLVAMPLCIAAVALMGSFAGLSIGAAILLGAVLVPTDPVLAADVQVGPPLEGGEHPVRFSLTTEAGLNDGLAFPFVYMGILLLSGTFDFGEWLGIYVLYKIIIGVVVGSAAGWVLAKIIFHTPKDNLLAEGGSGVIALAGVLLTYGLCELTEGYGFIAVFVMGLILRRRESQHEFHGKLHSFTESVEQSITAILLIMIGASAPLLWEYLDLSLLIVGILLIFIIRPLAGMLSLIGSHFDIKQRMIISYFGVRGIGSIFYLAYAVSETNVDNMGGLWATTVYIIIISALVHGLTASSFITQREA